MRKLQKVLSGLFLFGVLIAGVGTGIAVVEYTSLKYAGERVIGAESLKTENLDFTFEPGEEKLVLAYDRWPYGNERILIEDDESLPVGLVRYEVTYNEDTIQPVLHFEDYLKEEEQEQESETEESAEETTQTDEELSLTENSPEYEEPGAQTAQKASPYMGELYLSARYRGSDFARFMQYKDEILNGLKQKQIFSYEQLFVTDVKIRINPQTRKYIHTVY